MNLCEHCMGTGCVLVPDKFGEPEMSDDICPYCNGSGRIEEETIDTLIEDLQDGWFFLTKDSIELAVREIKKLHKRMAELEARISAYEEDDPYLAIRYQSSQEQE